VAEFRHFSMANKVNCEVCQYRILAVMRVRILIVQSEVAAGVREIKMGASWTRRGM
jgi:DNA-directed RNA polymerase subunit RPC12/RpoP